VLVREISGENTSLADIYLQIFDRASAPLVAPDPSATSMVFTPIRVPAGKRYDILFTKDEFPKGFVFNDGIYVVASQSKYTYLPVLAAAIDCQVLYDHNVVV
jgi:hypothetical protein